MRRKRVLHEKLFLFIEEGMIKIYLPNFINKKNYDIIKKIYKNCLFFTQIGLKSVP